jgi:hypothetical protein
VFGEHEIEVDLMEIETGGVEFGSQKDNGPTQVNRS